MVSGFSIFWMNFKHIAEKKSDQSPQETINDVRLSASCKQPAAVASGQQPDNNGYQP
jgi:hypothetical protein